jgi:hypothetical protein
MRGAEILKEPKQTGLSWVEGNPEGVYYGPPGYAVIDQDSGTWYRKTTPIELNTGWEEFSTGSIPATNIVRGIIITSGLPVVPPPIPTVSWLAYDPVDDIMFLWRSDIQIWE